MIGPVQHIASSCFQNTLPGLLLITYVWLTSISLAEEAAPPNNTFPGKSWEERSSAEVGLQESFLVKIPEYLKGRGMIVKDGYRVFSWGDASKAGDVASAAKPIYTHFLAHAVETGRLSSFDQKVKDIHPELGSINAGLDHKDRQMTFAHLATQTACYGVNEAPGSAYDYNDFQMAFFLGQFV
jgi:CubicO group peptidase (beta-lactamase class C family)